MPLPQTIQNAPELIAGLELFFQGFLDLATQRQAGFGQGWIPTLAVLDYCDRLELGPDDRRYFLEVIKRLDSRYLEWVGKQRKDRGKQPSGLRTEDAPARPKRGRRS